MTADEAKAQNLCRLCGKPPEEKIGMGICTYDGDYVHWRCRDLAAAGISFEGGAPGRGGQTEAEREVVSLICNTPEDTEIAEAMQEWFEADKKVRSIRASYAAARTEEWKAFVAAADKAGWDLNRAEALIKNLRGAK